MTKKEYILKVLDKVIPYWEWAVSIKEKVLDPNVTDDYIQEVYQKCVKAVHSTFLYQKEKKVNQLANYLEYLHQQELDSQKADKEDIDKLDEMLKDM